MTTPRIDVSTPEEEVDELRRALMQAGHDLLVAKELLAEAYDGWGEEGHATNGWRVKVERLGAWRKP